LLVASRAGLACRLHLSANRFLIALVDHGQQLAGFDDEMLLRVEKAVDAAPLLRGSSVNSLPGGKIAGIDLASVTAFIAASSAAVCSPSPLAKSPIWASEARIVLIVACRAGMMLSAWMVPELTTLAARIRTRAGQVAQPIRLVFRDMRLARRM
jgi:hypothetical protein